LISKRSRHTTKKRNSPDRSRGRTQEMRRRNRTSCSRSTRSSGSWGSYRASNRSTTRWPRGRCRRSYCAEYHPWQHPAWIRTTRNLLGWI